ncbi:MAG: hypothetical protein NC828_01585, partial [Candidatus Omnitrophica bacterium]|nr:hypothetical protein [Candidatus Omnitrophota bacterium]
MPKNFSFDDDSEDLEDVQDSSEADDSDESEDLEELESEETEEENLESEEAEGLKEGEEEEGAAEAGKAAEAAEKVERKLSDELAKIVDLVGKDEELKSKGLTAKVGDFTPDEVKAFLQKGLRFYQAMAELSEKEKLLAQRASEVEAWGRQLQALQLQMEAMRAQERKEPEVPKELRITDEDTPEIASLKKAAQDIWKQNQALSQQYSSFENYVRQQQQFSQDAQLLDEIQAHQSDFPLASPGEVRLRITAKAPTVAQAEAMIDEMDSKIVSVLGQFVF